MCCRQHFRRGLDATGSRAIDCSTAAENVKTLNSEKARTSQEIEDGASSVIPMQEKSTSSHAGE